MSSELPQEVVARTRTLWLRMTEIYGYKWTSSYGASDSDHTWSKALVDITPAEMKRGFYTCLTNGQPWPPSAPEFRAMCRPPRARREHPAAYQFPPDRQLTHELTHEQRERGRQHIAELLGRLAPRRGSAARSSGNV